MKQAGFKFRQQVPIDHFIVDFACLSERLIIELDGGTHSSDQELIRDATRERYLRGQDFRILRFWNADVMGNIEGVMDSIVGALGPPPPSPPRKGEGSHSRLPSVADSDADAARAQAIAAAVLDPEIPVLTLEDLGVLRGVERREGRIVVKLTPTYTGCPATLAIQLAVEAALAEAGMTDARVETVLSPPWSTDQITEEGRRKLKEFGIAPPNRAGGPRALFGEETRGLPEVRLDGDRENLRVRLDRLQGAVALRGLRRAVRLLQVHLTMLRDFHAVTIAEVKRETPDAISVAFAVPEALREAFRFQAGQHLTLRTLLDDEEVRRNYSICSGPGDALRIAIKRVDGGYFSDLGQRRRWQPAA